MLPHTRADGAGERDHRCRLTDDFHIDGLVLVIGERVASLLDRVSWQWQLMVEVMWGLAEAWTRPLLRAKRTLDKGLLSVTLDKEFADIFWGYCHPDSGSDPYIKCEYM